MACSCPTHLRPLSLAIATLWWIWGGSLAAANFPPVAQAACVPAVATLGVPFQFSSAGSADPDNGPQPLSYRWDFGDGQTSTQANPSHAYSLAGLYVVRLTVSDGADSAVVQVTACALKPPTATPPVRSSPIALDASGRWLWTANQDSNSVSLIDTQSRSKVAEIPVGMRPRTVALNPAGTRLYVVNQNSHSVSVLDTTTRAVIRTVAVGHLPFGVAVTPDGTAVLVTSQGNGRLYILDPDSLNPLATLPIGGKPRAIAISFDSATAYVTHYLTTGAVGVVTAVDLSSGFDTTAIALAEDPGPDSGSSGRGFPNLLNAAVITPAGDSVWIGCLKSNTGRGLFNNGQPLLPTNRVRGLFAPIDAGLQKEIINRRIDTDNADCVADAVFSPNGRYAYLLHQGAGMLSIYDLPMVEGLDTSDGSEIPFAARITVGEAPQGAVLSPDGVTLYVLNFLSRNVVCVDVADPAKPAVIATVATTVESLPARVANGKRLFYNSTAPRMSQDNYIACASCHADGGMTDGRTWDFTQTGEGLRNTIDLRGHGGTADGPLHWTANFNEVQDFENDIVNGFGGTGLAQDAQPPYAPLGPIPNAGRSADLDDLALYVQSLDKTPPSPWRNADGSLTAAAVRGKAIFYNKTVGCAACHATPRFTDSTLTADPTQFILHNVGTITPASGKRIGGPLTGFDTPSLKGAWATAPYLHDGSAPTLRDVFTTRNAGDRHGVTSSLSAGDLDDLAAFVNSIDDRADVLPVASVSDRKQGCGLNAPGTWLDFSVILFGLLLTGGLMAGWSRRKRSQAPGVSHV